MERKERSKKGSSRSVEITQEEQPQHIEPAAAPIEELPEPDPVIEEIQQESIYQEEPKLEPPPTRNKISTTPPAYTDDVKQIVIAHWAIEGRVPITVWKEQKWIKAKNFSRELGKGKKKKEGKKVIILEEPIEAWDQKRLNFIEGYELAAQMYREQAEKYNKSLK